MSDLGQVALRAAELVESLPRNVARGLVTRLRALAQGCTLQQVASVLASAVPQEQRGRADALLESCRISGLGADSGVLALVLDAASLVRQKCRDEQSVEVVWSGPVPPGSPLRRTEQALLEAISKAEREIWLLSYVAYKVHEVRQALVDAVRRGVGVNLLLETVETSEGRIDHDGLVALRAAVGAGARVYEWPAENRPRASDGRRGVLHAKACLVDGAVLFTSSANMTSNAFELNMELGVLIWGGPQPRAVADQLAWLVVSKTIQLVQDR